MIKPVSIKARLTAIFVMVFAGVLIAYSYIIYQTVEESFQSGFDLQVIEFANEVADAINYSVLWGFQLNPKAFSEQSRNFPFTQREAVFQIRSKKGEILMSSPSLKGQNLPFSNLAYQAVLRGERIFQNWKSDTPIYRNKTFRVFTFSLRGGKNNLIILQIAVPDRFVRSNMKRIFNTFLYSIPFLLLIAGLIGYSYEVASLRPVKLINDRVHTIRRGNLSERVPVSNSKDEISELAETINDMLERVEKSFEAQERFVSDASHQMKTPLAILKGQLDEMYRKRDSADFEELAKVRSLQEEVDSLIALVNNLLILARIDLGQETLLFSEVHLEEAVTTVCERLKPLAQKKNIQFRMNLVVESESLTNSPFIIQGDQELLMSLFQSIIENSIKYSSQDSKVQILVKEASDQVSVEVRDNGPGIDSDDLQTIFDRFNRGKKSSQLVSGSGLGLSIAKRISDLHSAGLTVENASEGSGLLTRFTIKKV